MDAALGRATSGLGSEVVAAATGAEGKVVAADVGHGAMSSAPLSLSELPYCAMACIALRVLHSGARNYA